MRRTIRLLVSGVLCLAAAGLGSISCEDASWVGYCPPSRVCFQDGDCQADEACVEECCGGRLECLEDEHCQGSGSCCRDGACTTDCGFDCETQVCLGDEECSDLGPCMECADGCCVSFECDSDSDCPPEGQFERYCPKEPDPDLDCRVCEYVRCVTHADCSDPDHPLSIDLCPDGLVASCQSGLCECALACGGQCPDGQYCCQASRKCEPVPDACPQVTCPPCEQLNPSPGGFLDDQACEFQDADCSCVPLPALPDAFAGQHSAMALGSDGIPVFSGYYGAPYGDLLFGVASSAQAGASVSWTLVDGVPANAPCVGAQEGLRKGIGEPGDDVGWDTDLVLDSNGLPRISYFDRTHQVLKYASFDGVDWSVHVVDQTGSTGRFTSLRLDSTGKPLVAYMTTRENMNSYLKVAWSKTNTPASLEDWDRYWVDMVAVPCLPIDCAPGEACLKETGACALVDDSANCNNGQGCPSGQVCVDATCQEEAHESSLEGLLPGVGLFASLALYTDGSPAVAYYDSTQGNLKFAWWNPNHLAFDPPVILAGQDGAGADLGNLGSDADMFISVPGDTVHIAFQDADLGDLYYLTFQGKQIAGTVVELVDAGARDADGNPTDFSSAVGAFHWVGNFAKILVDFSGNPRVAYQDGTSLDLVYAIRDPGGWQVEILASGHSGQDAYGFFVDQVLGQASDLALISNFKHNLHTEPWTSGMDIRTR